MALRDEGTYPLRVFSLMKEVMDGSSGENLLGIKDLIYQPVMIIFSFTITIQFFPESGRFSPQSLFLLELLLKYGI